MNISIPLDIAKQAREFLSPYSKSKIIASDDDRKKLSDVMASLDAAIKQAEDKYNTD